MSKILRISARRESFRRAGIAHTVAAADHPLDTLTAEQIAALKAEPMLLVVELDVPEVGKKAAATK